MSVKHLSQSIDSDGAKIKPTIAVKMTETTILILIRYKKFRTSEIN